MCIAFTSVVCQLRPQAVCSRRVYSGVMIVYLIIIADMLVGSAPQWSGVLTTLLGRHDGPWFLSRPFVVSNGHGTWFWRAFQECDGGEALLDRAGTRMWMRAGLAFTRLLVLFVFWNSWS